MHIKKKAKIRSQKNVTPERGLDLAELYLDPVIKKW